MEPTIAKITTTSGSPAFYTAPSYSPTEQLAKLRRVSTDHNAWIKETVTDSRYWLAKLCASVMPVEWETQDWRYRNSSPGQL